MKMNTRQQALLFVLMIFGCMPSLYAMQTEITVRVISRDAKFVGTSVGGAHVVVRDAETGVVLAQGVTEGSTGDTDRIMKQARERNMALATEGAAKFTAMIDIDRPTHVEVTAFGPMDDPHAANSVTASQWVLPGRGTTGDGWVLELPGLVVDIHDTPLSVEAGKPVPIRATVEMMCGCPLEPGGLWDSRMFEVSVLLRRNDEVVERLPMKFAGSKSEFEAAITVPSAGQFDVEVWAYQQTTGNAGFDAIRLQAN